MSNDLLHSAMAAWAAKDLPARLHSSQVAKLLNCSTEDVAILASSGKLRPLGKPRPSAVKYFGTIELFVLLADRSWLDEVTKTISSLAAKKRAPQGLPAGNRCGGVSVELARWGRFKRFGPGRSRVPGPDLFLRRAAAPGSQPRQPSAVVWREYLSSTASPSRRETAR